MKTASRFLLVLGTALALGTAAVAQTEAPPPGPRGPHGRKGGPGRGPMHPVIRVLDADHDRVVSATELANAPTALRTLDTDGDGIVAATELRPGRPANAPTPPADAPARPPRDSRRGADPLMLALDANGDGDLSEGEVTNAAESLKALDANKDGALSADELRPLPPAN